MSNPGQQHEQQPGQAFSEDEFSALLNKEFRPKTDQARSAVESAVKTLAQQALENTVTFSNDTYRTIQNLIAGIDEQLARQGYQIIHHDDFQKLESALRGLSYLGTNSDTDEMLKIRFMSISKQELGRTLKRFKGVGWDQSPIFKKVYEQEYGQFGGEPFGCIVGDYYFDHGTKYDELLGEMARIGSAAHCPFITGTAPGAGQPARPDQDLPEHRVRRLAFAARIGRRPLSGPGDAAFPRPPAVRHPHQPGGRLRL